MTSKMSLVEEECRLEILIAYCHWMMVQRPMTLLHLLHYKRALGLSETSALTVEWRLG